MKRLRSIFASVLVLALVLAPVLHVSAVCAGAPQEQSTGQPLQVVSVSHAHAHGDEHHQHSSDHGKISQHDDKACCDTSCNMACSALLPTVSGIDEPSASRNTAASTPFHRGFSLHPDLPPPKSLASVTAAA